MTTAMIAQRAGVPIGSLYQYFPNKLAVLTAVASEAMDHADLRIEAVLAAPVGECSWAEEVDRVVDAVFESYARERGFIPLLRALSTTPELREITHRSNDRIVAGFIQRVRQRGENIGEADLQVVARVAVEAANTIQDLALASEDPHLGQRYAQELKVLLKSYLGCYASTVD